MNNSNLNQPGAPSITTGIKELCHEESEARRGAIIDLAREKHQKEGELEIDDGAVLSEGDDNGCYVAAWVWVDFAESRFDKKREEQNDE